MSAGNLGQMMMNMGLMMSHSLLRGGPQGNGLGLIGGPRHNALLSVEPYFRRREFICSPYAGHFGVASFRQFRLLRELADLDLSDMIGVDAGAENGVELGVEVGIETSRILELDEQNRPTAVGIHLDPPTLTALGTSRFLACVQLTPLAAAKLETEKWINNPEGFVLAQTRPGYFLTMISSKSPLNSWTDVKDMEISASKLPDLAVDEMDLNGPWWEEYPQTSWDDLETARIEGSKIIRRLKDI